MHRAALLAAALLWEALGCHSGEPSPPALQLFERVQAPRTTLVRPPLLVLLHGLGMDETGLLPLAARFDPHFMVAGLRGPYAYNRGYGWYAIEFHGDGSLTADYRQGRRSVDSVVDWLKDAPQRLGTDPERTYLLGFSQGAVISLAVLHRIPERLAGVVALSGVYADELFADETTPAALGEVPLFVAHGLSDNLLPIAHGRAIRDAFQKVSCDLTYKELALGHTMNDEEMREIATWLHDRLGRPTRASACHVE